MSVVAIPFRPYRSAGRPREARPPIADAVGRPAAPTLTITVDLAPGPVSPRVTRLLDLLGELAETGEGRLRPAAADRAPAVAEPAPPPAQPVDPRAVCILAGTRVVRQGGRAVRLTRIEYDLLLFLAQRPHRVFTRLQLLTGVWGYEHAVARTVDVHVRRLRAKLGADLPVVTTVYGVGYRLADDALVEIDQTR
ncbi:winged helix-turn-helix domain-containing protein [Micromonospora endolithica]|uniref:Winged helix family transcriptional regulator n=1 Tax=Micromonospora endolithica TaxID=230091 RepID=A0A3A9ZK22_9ACTN|nr:winged helix-turn-helix domain-containing protein [Micromonospora endolithica]RKN48628.1 winged helix family transcriptional regulator [Micromonospora endolithica]TWJ22036.1 transcriptional regulator [Micromonospora endolithica]